MEQLVANLFVAVLDKESIIYSCAHIDLFYCMPLHICIADVLFSTIAALNMYYINIRIDLGSASSKRSRQRWGLVNIDWIYSVNTCLIASVKL